MKTIGFVDYYISEWHANHYPEWIAQTCEKTGLHYQVTCAWAEEYVSPVDGVNTDEWCRNYGIERCETIAELCEKCDCIIVLAPSDPQKHLAYAKEVLKYKKRTYIDKTFAPDFATAQAIFDLGKTYGTPFFSTSALRYCEELNDFGEVDNLIITGGGSNAPEYLIHQVEMGVKLIQSPARRVKAIPQGNQWFFHVDCAEKHMTFIFDPAFPFTICGETNGTSLYKVQASDVFMGLMADILRFFETGVLPFDGNQTLEVAKVREMALKAMETPDEWVMP